MSAPKVHLWRKNHPAGWLKGWQSWCGRDLTRGLPLGLPPGLEIEDREQTTCLNCLRAYAAHHRWQAERSVKAGNAAQDRIDKLVRAQGRRKRRAQR